MLVTTPERQRSAAPHLASRPKGLPRTFLLPPLSSILASETPFKPQLPSIATFATPQTPRYVLPPASDPRAFVTPLPASARPHISVSVPAADPKQPKLVLSPTDKDSDADTSMNDSMVRLSSKRKHSTTSPTRDFAFISHSPATYPSQEPSIDNASLARRKRRRTSPHELAILNQEFQAGSTPNKTRRIEIAKKVSMTEKAIQIWFQNKRQSLRRLRAADKEVTELPPTPDLSADHVATSTVLELTPHKPGLVKSHSQNFAVSPAMAQLSPIRSLSVSNLTHMDPANKAKDSLLTKMLAADESGSKAQLSLVLNLTKKKQPEFARQSPAVSTQVMTFRLAPSKERKPLAPLDHNKNSNCKSTKELQCVQNLLSLKSASY